MKSQNGCLFLAIACLSGIESIAIASTTKNYDWTGFYIGTKVGAAFSQFDTQTSTQGSLFSSEQANVVNGLGNQTVNTAGFLAGIEGGYNWQFNNQFLLGLGIDIQSLGTNGLKYNYA
ncbi:MAG: hypothetical protein EPN84_13375, partial [Legionella sp.]